MSNSINEFMLMSNRGAILWRARSPDIHFDVNPATGNVVVTVDLPEGLYPRAGDGYVWRCDARRLASTTVMVSFVHRSPYGVVTSGAVPNRPVNRRILEAQIEY